MVNNRTALSYGRLSRWRVAGVSLMACMVFVGLFGFLGSRYYAVELNLQSSADDHVRVYWAPAKVPFSEAISRAFHVKQGTHAYQVVVFAGHLPARFQIKAGDKIKQLGIGEIRFKRLGRYDGVLSDDTLSTAVTAVQGNMAADLLDGQLSFTAADEKIKITIGSLTLGARAQPWLSAMLLILGLVLTLCVVAARMVSPAARASVLRYVTLALGLTWFVPVIIHNTPFEWLLLCRVLSVVCLLVFVWPRAGRVRQFFTDYSPSMLVGKLALPVIFLVFIVWSGASQIGRLAGFEYHKLLHPTQAATATQQFEDYLGDQFLHKPSFIRLNSEVKVSLLGTSPTPKVILGKQGFMFEGRGERRVEGAVTHGFDNISDYLGRNPFTEAQLVQWAQVLQERRDWLAARDVPYLFVMAPTKAMIYGEHLPWMLRQRTSTQRRYDVLYEYLRTNTTVPVLDLRPALLKAKQAHQYPELYYRTDFHWNFFGAFFAYEAILEAINHHYPSMQLDPLVLDDFDIKVDERWAHPKFMAMMGLDPEQHKDEHYVRLVPKSLARFAGNTALPDDGIRDVHWPLENVGAPGQQQPVRTIRNATGETPFMVVFGDSFIQKTLLYLSVHAERLVYQRAVFEFPMHVLKQERPTIVIQEILNMFILRQPPHNPALLKQ